MKQEEAIKLIEDWIWDLDDTVAYTLYAIKLSSLIDLNDFLEMDYEEHQSLLISNIEELGIEEWKSNLKSYIVVDAEDY